MEDGRWQNASSAILHLPFSILASALLPFVSSSLRGYIRPNVLKKVDRILLRVESLEGAVSYYRDVVGLKLLKQDPRLASFQLLDGQTELVLHADADLPDQAMYYLVDNVKDLYRRREALKLKFSGPPTPISKGFRATVKDPFGNVLLLLDRAAGHEKSTVVEDAKTPGGLFAGVEQRAPVKKALLI